MPLPQMTRPVTLVAEYPPLNSASSVPIGPGVNWTSVTPAGRTPAEVIFFNFGTSVAREVNWYMWHYLGCTQLAPDGINLTFGTNPANPSIAGNPFERFKPGDSRVVYLPPTGWRIPSTDDELLRADVLSVLDKTIGISDNHFSFTINSERYSLPPGALKTVHDQVKLRKIFIRHDPSAPMEGGYIHGNSDVNANTLRLVFSRVENHFNRALIVHEAVHAAFDIASRRMPSRVSESMAYVAQCHYLGRVGADPLSVTSDRPLFVAAVAVATRIREGVREFTEADLGPLVAQIALRYPRAVYAYDGV